MSAADELRAAARRVAATAPPLPANLAAQLRAAGLPNRKAADQRRGAA